MLYIYIHIYIYKCVRVCVCCIYIYSEPSHWRSETTLLRRTNGKENPHPIWYIDVVKPAWKSKCEDKTCLQSSHLPLQWRHNDHDSASNHQPPGCLLNRLFRRRSKKTSKLRVTGLCVGNSPGPVNSPHKGPVTRKMFPFGDIIMRNYDLHTEETASLYRPSPWCQTTSYNPTPVR